MSFHHLLKHPSTLSIFAYLKKNWRNTAALFASAAVLFILSNIVGSIASEKLAARGVDEPIVLASRVPETILPQEHIAHLSDASSYTFIEYIDLDCPHCQKLHTALAEFFATHARTNTFIVRHFPLTDIHPRAKEKAIIAECVSMQEGETVFFEFLDGYFTTKDVSIDVSAFTQYAETFVRDTVAFEKCIQSDDALNRVTQSVKQGLYSGVFSTPSLVVLKNGVLESRYDLLTDTSGVAIIAEYQDRR